MPLTLCDAAEEWLLRSCWPNTTPADFCGEWAPIKPPSAEDITEDEQIVSILHSLGMKATRDDIERTRRQLEKLKSAKRSGLTIEEVAVNFHLRKNSKRDANVRALWESIVDPAVRPTPPPT
jgi:transcriptional regulator of met regulon